MNIWSKILLFFPVWLIFLVVFYGVVFLFYPESFSGSKIEFETLISSNYGFLLINQIAIFLGTFSAIFFVCRVIDKQKMLFLNSMLKPGGLLFGVILGTLAILIIILILSINTKITITYNRFNISNLSYILVYFLVAVTEEALVRGFIFANLFEQTNKYLAILISSLIFSLMHSFNSSFDWLGMVNILLIGILFCQLYLKKMNLSIPIGFHFIWNLLQGPVFGFSVSGLLTQGIFKIKSFSGSKFSFEGFGLEGSLISTCVISFLIAYFYITSSRKILYPSKVDSLSLNVVD